MSRQKTRNQNGIKLPFALQKELGLHDEGGNRQGNTRHAGSSVAKRKEMRKDVRAEKRHRLSHNGRIQDRRRDQNTQEEGGHETRDRIVPKVEASLPKSRPLPKSRTVISSERSTSWSKASKPRSPSPGTSDSEHSRASSPGLVLDPNSRSFKQHAADDNAEIAALERRLGMKGKNKSGLEDEMLDFVLEGLEDESNSKKRKRDGRDWLDMKRQKFIANDDSNSESNMPDVDGIEDLEDEDLMEMEEEDGDSDLIFDNEDKEDTEDDLEVFDEDMIDQAMENEHAFDGFGSDKDFSEPSKPVRKVRENPYVAPVAPGGATGKYVPPSLRKRAEVDTSGLEGLRRQMQGQLNKLSEANIMSILGEIEKLYRLNPRQDVTTVLIDLILTSFSVRSSLQNTFIILHAAFLAAVYKVMGTDFGAELLVRLVERFDQEFENAEAGKEALNLISLLANLFTFNLVTSNIVYDHVRLLLQDFSESNTELLLRVVRDCGPQLRSDDPSALKEIIQTMQHVTAEMNKNGRTVNVRTQVMMDTITDLKNNKMKNATNAAGMTGEHITRMRKALGSLNNRPLKATEPLRITRDDIANSDKKGKWWLVGASWKSNESKQLGIHEKPVNQHLDGVETRPADDDVDLLALARQYRMNTDVRRSIFVAIMSANDCRDAQTRLLKLRLSTKQEQEFAKVLLRCARAEPAYNPYYALLAKNICKDNKKVRIGFQFGLWDFFRRMGEKPDDESDDEDDSATVEMHEIVNIAKMFAHLIFHGHLNIGILKTLNFGFLREQATMFLEVLLISIMTQPKAGEEELIKVFSKATEATQIVKGLRYFIKKNVRKSDLVSKRDRDRVKAGCRMAETALDMIGSEIDK